MEEEENEPPRPWIQGELNPGAVFDAEGVWIAECADPEVAALIVRLVNAKGKGKG